MPLQGPSSFRLWRHYCCWIAGVTALSVCAESRCQAQPGSAAPFDPPPRFERLPVPRVTVFHILQDSRGFIWMATESGLYRWDGYRTTLFRPGAEDAGHAVSLNTNRVVEDRQGNIWSSTDSGLGRLDRRSGRFTILRHDPDDPASLSSNSISTLAVDGDDTLWVGGNGLNRYDARRGTFQRFAHDPHDNRSLSDNTINEICVGADGSLWVGTNVGLDRVDPATGLVTRFETTGLHPSGLPVVVNTFAIGAGGHLWVGTSAGAFDFDPGTGRFDAVRDPRGRPEPWLQQYIRSIGVSPDGRTWFGTDRGLVVFDPRRPGLKRYLAGSQPQTLPSDRVRAILVDRDGALWLAPQGAGLCRYEPSDSPWAAFQHDPSRPDSLSLSGLFGSVEDESGGIWLGTDGHGVERLDIHSGRVIHYRAPGTGGDTASPADVVRDVARDAEGRIWAATYGGGLLRIDPASGRVEQFVHDPRKPHGLDGNHVRALHLDSRGTLWIGTLGGGLHRYNQRTGEIERIDGVYEQDRAPGILDIGEGRDGTLWLGTYGSGVLRIGPDGRSQSYRSILGDDTTLTSDTVWALHVARNGVVWLATYAGLNALDPVTGRVRRYREEAGLPGEAVKAVVEDASGTIWVSTNGGIARFDAARQAFEPVSPDEGMQAGSYNLKAALCTSEGLLAFGGSSGLLVFDPARLARNRTAPIVLLTGLRLFGRPVAPGSPGSPLPGPLEQLEQLVLQPSQSSFSLEFVALSYRAASHNRYRFRLQGLSENWIDADSSQRVATFTGLPAGTYHFQVIASNNDGVWNEAGARLRIVVLPPWWRSNAALAVYVLLLGLGIMALVRVRTAGHRREIARQREVNEQLERRVHERTAELELLNRDLESFTSTVSHDLRAPLRAIEGFASMLLDRHAADLSEEAGRYAGVIRDRACQMERLIESLLHFSRLGRQPITKGPVDMAQLVNLAWVDLAAERAGREVELRVGPLPPAVGDRILLKQVWQNLLGNAQKFTRGREIGLVEVGSERGEQGPVYVIRDNGAGFDAANAQRLFGVFQRFHPPNEFEGTGVGLATVARIVERHGGRVWAESTAGQGAVFRFTLGDRDEASPHSVLARTGTRN